jgi:hypothetical protein
VPSADQSDSRLDEADINEELLPEAIEDDPTLDNTEQAPIVEGDSDDNEYANNGDQETFAPDSAESRGGERYRLRSRNLLRSPRVVCFVNMTVVEALAKYHNVAVEAIMKELEIMVEKGVFSIVELSKLTSQQLRDVLPSKIFLKEKFVQKEWAEDTVKIDLSTARMRHQLPRSRWPRST